MPGLTGLETVGALTVPLLAACNSGSSHEGFGQAKGDAGLHNVCPGVAS